MSNLKSKEEFITELVREFPEIREEILDEDNLSLISLQMGSFRLFTQKAIDSQNIPLIKKCFSFLNMGIGVCDHEVENSLFISFLGKLNLRNNRSIEKLLSPKLAEVLKQLNEYSEKSTKNDEVKKLFDEL